MLKQRVIKYAGYCIKKLCDPLRKSELLRKELKNKGGRNERQHQSMVELVRKISKLEKDLAYKISIYDVFVEKQVNLELKVALLQMDHTYEKYISKYVSKLLDESYELEERVNDKFDKYC